MAEMTHTAEPAHDNVFGPSYRLYAAYLHARAEWDIVQYAPEHVTGNIPDDVNNPLSEAHTAALNRFLCEPADTPRDLATKLRVFQEHEIHDGWYLADEIVAALVRDAERMAERETDRRVGLA